MGMITINLTPEMHDALEHLGGRDRHAIAAILQTALRNDLRRRVRARGERLAALLEPHRATLAEAFSRAENWSDLSERLQRRGYRLAKHGGGLSLHNTEGLHICSASELGCSHAQLTRRFGRPFPQILMKLSDSA